MRTIAIIPARGGSVRIPGKNKKLFHGKPIIEYSIETAQKSRLFDEIVVSTDDHTGIGYIASRAGASVHYRKPDDGTRGTQEVAAEVLKQWGGGFSMACVLYATAPLLQEFDLWFGLHGLLMKPGTVFSYSTDPDGNDIGGYYWGPAFAFGKVPLKPPFVNKMAIPANRAIDINVQADWDRAEAMYSALKEAN